MSKLLTILNIGHKLFYQVYENEKIDVELEKRIIENNSEVTVAEIIRDNRLNAVKEVGVILINIDKKLDLILKKAFKKASKFNVIQEFDNYKETIRGNDSTNYGASWCIMDSLTENVEVYGLDEQSKLLLLNKSEAESQFFDEVIKDIFPRIKPQIGKTEQEELLKAWKTDLDSSNEVDRNFLIKGEDKRVIFNNENYVNWTFGSLLNDINKNFSSKQNFYLFGDFLNNKFLETKLKRNGQNIVNYKSEIDAAQFIINGAVQLCESEADIEIKEIRSKDDPSKIYSKAELKELYESKNIRYFIESIEKFKEKYKFPTEDDKEAVRDEVVKKIGKQLEIDETTKKQLIKIAKERGIGLSLVEKEIKKVIDKNKKEYQEKKDEILEIINTYVKNKKITKASSETEKAILAKLDDVNVEGFNIDKEQIINKQLSNLEDSKPPIPWEIIASVLLILVVVGFGVMQFISKDGPTPPKELKKLIENDYSNNTILIPDAFREIHNPSTKSKIAKEIATKVSNDLRTWKVQSTNIETISSVTQRNNVIYSLKELTDFIRGDRAANPQTIKSIEIDLIEKKTQTIKLTLKRTI